MPKTGQEKNTASATTDAELAEKYGGSPHFHGMKNDYPAQVYPENYHPEYLAYLERAAAAVKTIRLVVYAGLAGFILLAAYGFFLIYLLTTDTHRMVDQSVRMTEQMQSMARIMANMYGSMAEMRVNTSSMSADMASLHRSIRQMDGHIGEMNANIRQMTNTVGLIQHSATNMDRSIAPAANMMNSFVPFWGGNRYGSPPYAGPAPR